MQHAKKRKANTATVEVEKSPPLTENEVALIRELHEEYPRGHPRHLGYGALGAKFGKHRNTIRGICTYTYR